MRLPVERSLRLRCPPAHAFAVFTDRLDVWWPKGHRRFADSRMVLEARVGGRLVERSSAGEEADLGEVLACDPPALLVYSWRPGALGRPTEVTVRFTAEGAHTLVEVSHAEGSAAMGDLWPQRAELFARSWDTVLAAYAGAVETRGAG